MEKEGEWCAPENGLTGGKGREECAEGKLGEDECCE